MGEALGASLCEPDPMNPFDSNCQLRQDSGAIRLGPETAERRLVLLHGWGADADDLLDLAELLVPPEVSVISLRAPEPHPAGVGRQWYPLLWSAEMVPEPAWERVPAAREALRHRLLDLDASVPLERTALLGFSQGAAMALDVATGGDQPLPLSAVIGCSGYPHRDWRPQAGGTPVLLTHGLEDPVVSAEHCERLLALLQAAGIRVERHLFRGGHGIDPDLLPALARFLEGSWRG
jgi:phospholipase/carboxylesterase